MAIAWKEIPGKWIIAALVALSFVLVTLFLTKRRSNSKRKRSSVRVVASDSPDSDAPNSEVTDSFAPDSNPTDIQAQASGDPRLAHLPSGTNLPIISEYVRHFTSRNDEWPWEEMVAAIVIKAVGVEANMSSLGLREIRVGRRRYKVRMTTEPKWNKWILTLSEKIRVREYPYRRENYKTPYRVTSLADFIVAALSS